MSRILSLILIIMFPLVSIAARSIIHPLDFKGSEEEKVEVINQIKESVKQTYSQIGMADALTLRMMEKEELKAFKQLTKIKNRKLLDQVMQQYCSIDMCNYNTILMMYNEQNQASKEELSW
ncbi:hypothetical protein [Zooshikella harenae]|uniref:DUF4168 domain-containing protein n=1 Tax=Zooshikella harenae TaxID=2827238 RepID=A0ABS5ZJK7_9GAMM|nr:hypothetical protein [Zooshikella harenae]MBU2714262.1 hypothetical protein [Zooshikella harenae]